MRALSSAVFLAVVLALSACGGGGVTAEPPDVTLGGPSVEPLPVPNPTPTPEPVVERVCGDVPEPGRDRIRWAQRSLNDLGYDCGTVDGLAGRRTEACITDFQTEIGLEPSGALDPATREEIACAVGTD